MLVNQSLGLGATILATVQRGQEVGARQGLAEIAAVSFYGQAEDAAANPIGDGAHVGNPEGFTFGQVVAISASGRPPSFGPEVCRWHATSPPELVGITSGNDVWQTSIA